WTGVQWAYRIPVFIAYAFFVLATAFWPAPKNLAHLLALLAAVLIGLQLWYADHGGIYVLWYLPLLLLLLFRPNLSDRRPPPLEAAVLIGLPLGDASYRQSNFRNFRVVKPGVLYRSGQMSLAGLERAVHDYGIRTVVSLRDAEVPGERPPDLAEEEYCRKQD